MSSVAARLEVKDLDVKDPDVKIPVEQVMSGELFAGLLLDDTERRALALETLLGTVVGDDTRVVWVGNPLRSALTIERFLIQIAGPEIDLREERTPKELAEIIARQTGSETRLLVVVQQPETINAETFHLLVQMGWYLGGQAVQVQFLFTGSSSFVVPRIAGPRIAAFSSGFQIEDLEEDRHTAPRRRDVLPLLGLLLAVTIGVTVSMADAPDEGVPHRAPPSPDISLLRREFDAFLAQRTPPLPPMTTRDRNALFDTITNGALPRPQPK